MWWNDKDMMFGCLVYTVGCMVVGTSLWLMVMWLLTHVHIKVAW